MWSWENTEISFDQTCWTWDGYDGCTVAAEPPIDYGSVGRGSGPTSGIRPEGYFDRPKYNGHYDDMLRESNRNRQIRDDQDIVDIILTLLTKGIL